MGKRRQARILALSVLYQIEIRPQDTLEDLVYFTLLMKDYDTDVARFAEKLINGVYNHMEELDGFIDRFTDNWSISRMATIDKNVMRISIYEMKYLDDVPKNVSINEAVEIAKVYSTEKSGEFVNGVLDRIGNYLYGESGGNRKKGKKHGKK